MNHKIAIELSYCPNCETPTVNWKNRCRICKKMFDDSAKNTERKVHRKKDEFTLPKVSEVLPRRISKDIRPETFDLEDTIEIKKRTEG